MEATPRRQNTEQFATPPANMNDRSMTDTLRAVDDAINKPSEVAIRILEQAAVSIAKGESTAFGDPTTLLEARGELAAFMVKWKSPHVGSAQWVALWDVADKLLRALRSPVPNEQFFRHGAECFALAAQCADNEKRK